MGCEWMNERVSGHMNERERVNESKGMSEWKCE